MFPSGMKFPFSNMHEMNQDWLIRTVQTISDTVENIVSEVNSIFSNYVTRDDLTNNRKLKENGDFQGTWFGDKHADVTGQIDSNTDKIEFLTDQFEGGATGQVIDGGIAGDSVIDKNFDGGVV